MNDPYRPLTATQVLDLYFIENRSRVLDIASFLDRIDRYAGADEARAEYRYQALMRTLRLLVESPGDRTRAIQLSLSDPTSEPLDSAVGLKAWGAWEGAQHEGN
ncbi:MAG: hypothetical protein V5B39_19510 [Accumulibacter sp.]|jgi:hypothetical protein|uniref:hypothetical protein n=1 Tax=Accumulibacter sp. TaxID=2053492 RepID=UPI002FC34330